MESEKRTTRNFEGIRRELKEVNAEIAHIRSEGDTEGIPQFKDFSIDITGGIESSEFVRRLRDD